MNSFYKEDPGVEKAIHKIQGTKEPKCKNKKKSAGETFYPRMARLNPEDEYEEKC